MHIGRPLLLNLSALYATFLYYLVLYTVRHTLLFTLFSSMQGYTYIFRDENELKKPDLREDCQINEFAFNMYDSIMDPDLDNMVAPLLSCANGGRPILGSLSLHGGYPI